MIYLKGKWITFICYQELKWFLLSQRFNRTLVLSFDSYSLWYIFIFINHFWLIKIRIQFISLKWKWITFNCYQEIKWYVLSQRFHRTLVLSFDSFFLLIYFHLYQSFLADKDSNPVHILKGKWITFICYQELKWFLLSQRFNRTLVLSFDSYSLWYIFIFINHFWLIKIRIQFISLKWKWITFNCYQEIKWYVLSQRFNRTLVLSFDSFFLLIYFHLYQSFLADKDSNQVHIFKVKMNNFQLLSRNQMICSFSEV